MHPVAALVLAWVIDHSVQAISLTSVTYLAVTRGIHIRHGPNSCVSRPLGSQMSVLQLLLVRK